MNLDIRLLKPADQPEWLRMRLALWPDSPPEEMLIEMAEILADPFKPVFAIERSEGGLGGFVEVSLHREYTPGCETYPAGYIEGWYVDPDLRRQGLGSALIKAAEDWARSQGCHDMGSDIVIDNDISFKAHLSLGYHEVERLIHFHKKL